MSRNTLWRRHRGGLIAAVLGVIAIIGLTYTMFTQHSQKAPAGELAAPAGSMKITYKVTTDATFYGPAQITFSIKGQTDGSPMKNITETVERLPWTRDVILADTPNQYAQLSVWTSTTTNVVTCEVSRNGKPVKSDTGFGPNCHTYL